jgi:hypothetical protein
MPDRSNHKGVQVILYKIHQGGINYIASVSKSFKTAESGFAFAKRALDLCDDLGKQDCPDEFIHHSITEMRTVAKTACNHAKDTTAMFEANGMEFTEVRRATLIGVVIRQYL